MKDLHMIMVTNYLQNFVILFLVLLVLLVSFELFRAKIRNHIRTQSVDVENIIPVLCNYVYELNTQYNYRKELIFDVLVAIGYKDKKSILTYINAHGIPNETKTAQAIGTGGKIC